MYIYKRTFAVEDSSIGKRNVDILKYLAYTEELREVHVN